MSGKVASASSAAEPSTITADVSEGKGEKVVTAPKTFTARPVSPSKPYAAVTGAKERLPSSTSAEDKVESEEVVVSKAPSTSATTMKTTASSSDTKVSCRH